LEIGNKFSAEKKGALKGNSLAAYIRKTAPALVLEALANDAKGLETDGSPGKGVWAEVPWVTIFYPVVTTSATRGYYAVYLFSAEESVVYLSLNQGTTAVHEEFGTPKGNEVLRERANLINARVPDFVVKFDPSPIRLGSGKLAKGYEAGNAFGYAYNLEDLPSEEQLKNDLKLLCKAYLALQFRGGLDPSIETDTGEEGGIDPEKKTTIEERRRYRNHRRIERNPKAAILAKKGKLPVCQACGFEFEKFYGKIGKDYIEAHHLIPLGTLNEGEAIEYDPENDFSLLCSNCHRMIHRQEDPSDVERLIREIEANFDRSQVLK